MKFHDELNPKLWDKIENKYELKEEVGQKLNDIALAFKEFLSIPEDAILDIRITGSSANFNYTEHSDLDLHLIVDYEKLHEDCPLVEGYLFSKKSMFNKEHDISIYDVPVEVYAEDCTQEAVSNGVYSLEKGWIKEPEPIPPTDNDGAVLAKFNELKEAVDKTDDSEEATELLNKIYEMRKAGLTEIGELSTENLAFKMLRNDGCLDKLRDIKKQNIDKQLSLESFSEAKDDLYIVKAIVTSNFGYDRSTHYLMASDDKNRIWHDTPDIEHATPLTKQEWKTIIDNYGDRYFGGRKVSYTFRKYINNENNEYAVMKYWPSKAVGTLKLNELRKQIKAYGLTIKGTQQGRTHGTWGRQYSLIFVPKEQEGQLKQFIKQTQPVADVEFVEPKTTDTQQTVESYSKCRQLVDKMKNINEDFDRVYAREISQKLKQILKPIYGKISVTMNAGTKYPYINVMFGRHGDGNESKIEHRKLALEIIYGKDFETNDSYVAGNIQKHMMAMKPHEWEQFINRINEVVSEESLNEEKERDWTDDLMDEFSTGNKLSNFFKKNEDVDTFCDKIEQADMDIKDLIKQLQDTSNTIQENVISNLTLMESTLKDLPEIKQKLIETVDNVDSLNDEWTIREFTDCMEGDGCEDVDYTKIGLIDFLNACAEEQNTGDVIPYDISDEDLKEYIHMYIPDGEIIKVEHVR